MCVCVLWVTSGTKIGMVMYVMCLCGRGQFVFSASVLLQQIYFNPAMNCKFNLSVIGTGIVFSVEYIRICMRMCTCSVQMIESTSEP